MNAMSSVTRRTSLCGLQEAQERLDRILELSSYWYWEQDQHHRFTLVVGAASLDTGIDITADYGTHRWDYGAVPVADDGSWDKHKQLLDARQPFQDFVYKRRSKKGELHYILTSGVPAFELDGRFKGYRGIARDITAEVEAADVLKTNEARFRALAEASSDWIWEQDEDLRMSYVSKEAYSKAGYAAGSIIGKKRWELPNAVPLSGTWDDHHECLESRRPFRDFEYVRLRDGAPENYVSISGTPVFAEDGTFRGYRGVGRDITERKSTEERIRHMARHDSLTGLPNRAMFSELLNLAIQQGKRHKRSFAVLFVDLDRFKLINDTLGHDAGDALLREIAKRLSQTMRSGDIVARLGGDEFVVLMQEIQDPRNVSTIAHRLLSELLKPVSILGQDCHVTGSIGIAVYPSDGEDEQVLIKNADAAMYHAKEKGKNNFQFYSEQMNAHSLERLALESSLRKAIERNEFLLHYQAKLDLESGAICGVEALLRWQHPDVGIVSPAQFLPLAEETGLILAIGRWVLLTACQQNVAWQKQGLPALKMAVNVSPRQFCDESFLKDVADAIESSGMTPGLLELELTEAMLMQDPKQAGKRLQALKDLGVRIAIDDFGLGYSSITRLKSFDIDILKVDRSFIRELGTSAEGRAMTEAIISVGRNLSIAVVAEGVETEEQAAYLRELNCNEMQGYYFNRPTGGEECGEMLRQHLGTR